MYRVTNDIKHGGHPQTMLQIYQSLVTSVVMYGSSIYGNSSKTFNLRIETIHRKTFRVATGSTKTTLINSPAAISAVESLHIKRVRSFN